jgi:branched-chain amino acid aminotransferase
MGSYLRDNAGGRGGISLLAMSDHVRAWPGGFKLGLIYAPVFVAQRAAAALWNQQLLWLPS